MRTKRQVRRDIDIARACFANGLQDAVEDYDATVKALGDDNPRTFDKDGRIVCRGFDEEAFKASFDKFLARYGERKRKGAKFIPLSAKQAAACVDAHREFIMDAHARPEDLTDYVSECLGLATKKSQPALTGE